MTKLELDSAVQSTKTNTKTALQTVFDNLNQGQQNKLLKVDAIKDLFDLYGVEC